MTDTALKDESTFKCKYYVLYLTKFGAKTETDIEARGSNFKAHCHDEVVCPNCMHAANYWIHFVRATVART